MSAWRRGALECWTLIPLVSHCLLELRPSQPHPNGVGLDSPGLSDPGARRAWLSFRGQQINSGCDSKNANACELQLAKENRLGYWEWDEKIKMRGSPRLHNHNNH